MVRIRNHAPFTLESLGHFVEPVEIEDENGKLVGLFVPANLERGRELYERSERLLKSGDRRQHYDTTQPGRPFRDVIEELKAKHNSLLSNDQGTRAAR